MEPVKKRGGWFVDTPDGESGPWKTKDAAIAAGEGDFMRAQNINHRAMKRDKLYKGKSRG